MIITAKVSTVLKKRPIQSSQLPANLKRICSTGSQIAIADYSLSDKGHILIVTAGDSERWYIFDKDWELPWLAPNLRPNPITPASVNWHDFSDRVSEFFTVGEVTQKDSRRIPTDSTIQQNILTLAQRLDGVRSEWGGPIGVTSWYRPPATNRAVGGKKNSQHLYGLAADIAPSNGQIYQFQSWLDKRWSGALGYGAAKGFVHLDLRPGRIRWNY